MRIVFDSCRLYSYAVFKKNPPNNKNGIITGGPIDNAIDKLLLMQDIR